MNKEKPKAASAALSARSADLRRLAEETIVEWYDEKHRRRTDAEIRFVNSLEVESCPHCGSTRIRKDGFNAKTGIRVYECMNPPCGRKFNPLTNTIFDSKKIPISESLEFLYHVFQFQSSSASAASNMNARSTGYYRTAKLFLALEDLQGDAAPRFWPEAWIDEKYVSKWPSKSQKGANGGKIRGLSRNQYCVCTVTDGVKCALEVCGTGHPTAKRALATYSKYLDGNRLMRLVRDGAKCQSLIPGSLPRAVDEVHHVSETKGLPDKKNPMEPVNRVHRFLELFLKRHGGFGRESLAGWLSLFEFWYNTPGSPMAKAVKFIEMAVKKRKLLRYRAWAKRKKSDRK